MIEPIEYQGFKICESADPPRLRHDSESKKYTTIQVWFHIGEHIDTKGWERDHLVYQTQFDLHCTPCIVRAIDRAKVWCDKQHMNIMGFEQAVLEGSSQEEIDERKKVLPLWYLSLWDKVLSPK